MSNYPSGVSQRDITNLCQSGNSIPNQEECFLCHRMIEQDDDSRLWFDAELGRKPCFRSDWLDAFETQEGWCCGSDCYNDHAVESGPHASDCNVWVKEPCSCVTGDGIHLVKGRTA